MVIGGTPAQSTLASLSSLLPSNAPTPIFKRISIGYFLAAMSEIWLVCGILVDSPVSFMKKYYVEWLVAILLSLVYISLLYGLYVPNWYFEVAESNSTVSVPNYGVVTEADLIGLLKSLVVFSYKLATLWEFDVK